MTRKLRPWLSAAIGLAVLAMTAVQAGAETADLELKRLKSQASRVWDSSEFMLRYVSSQGGWMQLGAEQPEEKAAFAKAVKKEPAKYECKHPFKGVLKLGSDEVGYVLDSSDPKKGYDRLYLDLNRNGDLTDDAMIKAQKEEGTMFFGSDNRSFPRIEMTVTAGNSTFEYSFFLNVYSSFDNDGKDGYVSVSATSATYRQGEITLDGKRRKVYVLDNNSNGRFDDLFTVTAENRSSDGRIWPEQGDLVLIDPDMKNTDMWYDPTATESRHFAAKIIDVENKFYNLTITPAGDKLTLTPSTAAIGYVSNPNENFRAMVYGDAGVIRIRGTKGKPAPLPEGKWKLLSYTIDLTAASKPASRPEEQKARKAGILARLAGTILSSAGVPNVNVEDARPRYTLVSANGTDKCKAVKVNKGETVEMPFGPPYVPAVKVEEYQRGEGCAELSMSLVGAAGEVCSNVSVDGERPAEPTFAIVAPGGDIVERGKFEYG